MLCEWFILESKNKVKVLSLVSINAFLDLSTYHVSMDMLIGEIDLCQSLMLIKFLQIARSDYIVRFLCSNKNYILY